MGKTIRFNENGLIAIKKKLNEIMVGTDGVSHNDVCIKEAAPEVDEYTIGGEETIEDGVTDGVMGGNYYHVEESVDKNIDDLINVALKLKPDRFKSWVVIFPNNPGAAPRFFEKKSRAIEFKRMCGYGVVVNLDKYQSPLSENKEGKKIGGKNILTESQESKSIAAAKKLVMQRRGYNEQEADEFVKVKLRHDFPVLSHNSSAGKFIFGITRMFCDGELRNANDKANLNSTLKLVASDAHINEYDRNLNGLSAQELVQRFAKAMSDNLEAVKAEINQMVFDTPSDYEIVRIDSFEQAEEYGDYVSWCVTHDEDMFDSYTCDGINQFYFCLKNGFENVKKLPSEGCPLDEYGLSMVAVSVNENGMLNTCTCRWNHSNDGNDSIMDTKQVSQVISMNFFKVFKPNNKWKELLANVKQRLANGEDPEDVFDCVYGIRGDFGRRVVLNEKLNFINQEGRLISNQWFDYGGSFIEGFADVLLNGKCNYINQEGGFISNQWFDNVYPFSEGFGRVELNRKCNFINKEGSFLSDQWFDNANDFREGFATVLLNGKYYRLDTNGNLTLAESKNKNKKILVSESRLKTIKENVEKEVESSEVDLSSFKKRDTLPPGIWKDEDTLDSRVRLKLLDIADDFWEFVNLSWVEPKGIIITGSICNFNWSKFSDIDLHLVVDFNEIDEKTEFVKQYLDSKKNEWNTEHEGLKIMGFPVELYVQDSNDDVESGGIYDLEENAWIRKPSPHTIKSIGLNKFSIKDKAAEIMTIIDDMYDKLSMTDDLHEIEQIGDDSHYLWDKVKDLRKKSLSKNGESGSGNIVYKVLRRTGYLDKLFKLFSRVYDRSNSIAESKKVYISESKLQLLVESQESKSIEEAKRLLMARGGYSEERADWMVRYALRHDMPAFSRNPKAGKFILGVVRMYLDRQIMDATTVLALDDSIRIAARDEYNGQFDRNMNGMSAQDVIEMFAPIIRDINRQYREQVNSTTYTKNHKYTIVPIRDYMHATEFREDVDWCVCDLGEIGERSYDSYTCDGLCQLYFCLRDDYKTVQPVVGENSPLDDYGLSMIAICVNPDGDLRTCTTRWNHENGGTDKIMNPVEISNVIGRNFYDEFKPRSGNRYVESVNKSKEVLNESVKKYLTILKEEIAMDGSSEGNPYEKRWKAERDALKNFVANYGKLMQSREDNKNGKLYKVYFDKTMSDLIGYNYCICVQWNEQEMKPGSTVYIRALDKFTPFIRRDLQFDTRGRDNVRGNYDDTGY